MNKRYLALLSLLIASQSYAIERDSQLIKFCADNSYQMQPKKAVITSQNKRFLESLKSFKPRSKNTKRIEQEYQRIDNQLNSMARAWKSRVDNGTAYEYEFKDVFFSDTKELTAKAANNKWSDSKSVQKEVCKQYGRKYSYQDALVYLDEKRGTFEERKLELANVAAAEEERKKKQEEQRKLAHAEKQRKAKEKAKKEEALRVATVNQQKKELGLSESLPFEFVAVTLNDVPNCKAKKSAYTSGFAALPNLNADNDISNFERAYTSYLKDTKDRRSIDYLIQSWEKVPLNKYTGNATAQKVISQNNKSDVLCTTARKNIDKYNRRGSTLVEAWPYYAIEKTRKLNAELSQLNVQIEKQKPDVDAAKANLNAINAELSQVNRKLESIKLPKKEFEKLYVKAMKQNRDEVLAVNLNSPASNPVIIKGWFPDGPIAATVAVKFIEDRLAKDDNGFNRKVKVYRHLPNAVAERNKAVEKSGYNQAKDNQQKLKYKKHELEREYKKLESKLSSMLNKKAKVEKQLGKLRTSPAI